MAVYMYLTSPSDDERHLADSESILYVEVYACQTWLTIIIVRHWMSLIGESMYLSDGGHCHTENECFM